MHTSSYDAILYGRIYPSLRVGVSEGYRVMKASSVDRADYREVTSLAEAVLLTYQLEEEDAGHDFSYW